MKLFSVLAMLLIGMTIPALGQTQGPNDAEYEAAREAALSGDWRSGVALEDRLATAVDGFSPSYSLCGRTDEACAIGQVMLAVDIPFAYSGHYQAQRNVAFCLITGCDGAIAMNKPLGCAWRIVILASGSPLVDDSDRANLELCFEQLDAIGYATMRSQATKLFAAVFGRQIDPAWIAN